jgi:hypothetical protein
MFRQRIMMKTIRVVSVFGSVMAAACATAEPSQVQAPRGAQTLAPIPASVNSTWSALTTLLADRRWPVAEADRAAGSIATGWLDVPPEYASCAARAPGMPHVLHVIATQVRVDAHLRPDGTATEFIVDAAVRQVRLVTGRRERVVTVTCASTGQVEAFLRHAIESRVAVGVPHADGDGDGVTDRS